MIGCHGLDLSRRRVHSGRLLWLDLSRRKMLHSSRLVRLDLSRRGMLHYGRLLCLDLSRRRMLRSGRLLCLEGIEGILDCESARLVRKLTMALLVRMYTSALGGIRFMVEV